MGNDFRIPPVTPLIGLATHLGRALQRVATDALVDGFRSFPRRIADLDTVALLEKAL